MVKIKFKVCFTIIFVCSIYYFIDSTMSVKNEMVDCFYEQKENSIDVLMLGSSHMGVNVDGAHMWDNYGIASYAMWAPSQPFWNTYFYLVEALKTQTPKVVVVDVYAATYGDEYQYIGEQSASICSMKMSINKLNAIAASVELADRSAFIMGLPLYHDRYEQLSINDFTYLFRNTEEEIYKGYDTLQADSIGDYYNIDEAEDTTYIDEIAPKQEEYLIKIIQLCKNEGINLLLIKTPSAKRRGEQGKYNRVQEIAEEYNVSFIDYNKLYEVIGINCNDFARDGVHINKNGARKVANHLGRVLVDEYEVPDRGLDGRYNSWSEWSNDDYVKELCKLQNNELYFEQLARNNKDIIIIKIGGEGEDFYFKELCLGLKNVGVDVSELSNMDYGAWKHNPMEEKTEAFILGDEYSDFIVDNNEFEIFYEKPGLIKINGNDVYNSVSPSVVILVCGNNEDIIDRTAFCKNKNYQLVHF